MFWAEDKCFVMEVDMVSLIVVDYKTIPKTYEYIKHFHSMVEDKNLYHYIIVDNSGNDDGLEFMTLRCENNESCILHGKKVFMFIEDDLKICYVQAAENLGFAKGNNLGTIVSDELYDDKYYIISNNDLKLSGKLNWNRIDNIFNRDDSVAVVGPRVLGLNNEDQSPNKRVTPFYLLLVYQWTRFWPFKSKGDLDIKNESCIVYRIMGCFMILRADYFKRVNRFDEHTFLYGEEIILAERYLKYGLKNYYYREFIVIHEHGATVKKFTNMIMNDNWLFDSFYYYCKEYRNANKFLLKVARLNRRINTLFIVLKEKIKEVIRENMKVQFSA